MGGWIGEFVLFLSGFLGFIIKVYWYGRVIDVLENRDINVVSVGFFVSVGCFSLVGKSLRGDVFLEIVLVGFVLVVRRDL